MFVQWLHSVWPGSEICGRRISSVDKHTGCSLMSSDCTRIFEDFFWFQFYNQKNWIDILSSDVLKFLLHSLVASIFCITETKLEHCEIENLKKILLKISSWYEVISWMTHKLEILNNMCKSFVWFIKTEKIRIKYKVNWKFPDYPSIIWWWIAINITMGK